MLVLKAKSNGQGAEDPPCYFDGSMTISYLQQYVEDELRELQAHTSSPRVFHGGFATSRDDITPETSSTRGVSFCASFLDAGGTDVAPSTD